VAAEIDSKLRQSGRARHLPDGFDGAATIADGRRRAESCPDLSGANGLGAQIQRCERIDERMVPESAWIDRLNTVEKDRPRGREARAEGCVYRVD
jgi:hypothetical protein